MLVEPALDVSPTNWMLDWFVKNVRFHPPIGCFGEKMVVLTSKTVGQYSGKPWEGTSRCRVNGNLIPSGWGLGFTNSKSTGELQ